MDSNSQLRQKLISDIPRIFLYNVSICLEFDLYGSFLNLLSLFIPISVNGVKGQARLQFATEPYASFIHKYSNST